MKPEDIKRNYDAKISERSTLDGTLEYIERYVVPFRGNFFKPETGEHEVDWRKREIYDSTAVMAAQILSSSIQGGLMSMAYQWFAMFFDQLELNKNVEAKKWLESVGRRIYKELQDSNFDTEASEFCLDLVSFATATIIEEEIDPDNGEWEGINFKAIPMQNSYFDLDINDDVLRFYRKLHWTTLQVWDFFGDKSPEKIKELIKDSSSKMDQKHIIIFCVYKRDNVNVDTTKKLAAAIRPFGYKYVFHDDASQIGEEGGYYEMPTFITKWRKVAGSKFGHSPAFVALSDILTLNQAVEDTLAALGKVIDPSTMVTERGLLSDLDLGRGGLTVVRSKDDIWSYESKAKFDVGELKIQNLQRSIREAFYVDQLQLKESPSMTATEVQVRYELMQRLLGPTYGRIKNDFLDKVILRTFNILHRAGQLPEMPDVVKQEQPEIRIEYTGPIPRSQQLDEVRAVQEWVAGIAALAEIKPEILDNVDFDALAIRTAMKRGVPADLLSSEDKIKKIRKDRAAQQKRIQEAQIAEQEGKAAEATGKGVQSMGGAIEQR